MSALRTMEMRDSSKRQPLTLHLDIQRVQEEYREIHPVRYTVRY